MEKLTLENTHAYNCIDKNNHEANYDSVKDGWQSFKEGANCKF